MISRIRGTLRHRVPETQTVEIDVGGLSYEVLLPSFVWRAFEDSWPEEVEFFTYYHASERNPTPILVGFLRPAERDFFKKMLTVRGMGVGKARKAFAASVSTIARWIEDEDEAALRRLPGVGARQAAQIVAELRGKVVEEALLRDEQFTGPAELATPQSEGILAEAATALESLGYRRSEARDLVDAVVAMKVDEDLSLEEILRAVLQSQGPDAEE
jgi:Holliday junction DNA helicase RuvA